ncbi:MAG: U32 family peptidase [Trichlorobacter sp.]|nr:U32 family peptidase [Trichlorobacter sp.]
MQKPELLAPAGTMEKLEYAIKYGADAIYLGGSDFGLRAMAGNFSLPDLAKALQICHASNVRCYLTLNSYLHNNDFAQLEQYLLQLDELPFDAYIISDPGVLRMVRRISPGRELHLSTQANTTNSQAALFWQDQGVSRINLAREMSLEDIASTAALLRIPCEVFVHGALCVAYSGRCLLSSVMTGRSANKGACTQPCRWKYSLVEESRPGEYFPITEENDSTLVFNSRDLCLLEHLPELLAAGVSALKIEGRMKGIHYLAGVLRVYRTALDRLWTDPENWQVEQGWLEELAALSNREYTTGFLFGDPRQVGQSYQGSYNRSHLLVGSVEEKTIDGSCLVQVRNRFHSGDQLELIGPAMKQAVVIAENLRSVNRDGSIEDVDTVHPNMRILISLPEGAAKGDLLRINAAAQVVE